MLDSDRTRAPSPVTPQVKPVIIGGKRTKVPPPTSVEVDIDVDDERLNVFLNAEENESPEKDEEMQEPERKRRARGRPPKRERVVETSTPQEYQLTELTEQEAAALDYDTWLNKFPWETGQYTLKLRRQYPTQLQIGAKRVDIAGLIHEQNAPLYENEITEQFGGKTWQVVVVGPDPKTGKHRALSNKQLIVPGEPRLSAESLPHNMWIDVRPLLIEAGKLKEEDEVPRNSNSPRRSRLILRPASGEKVLGRILPTRLGKGHSFEWLFPFHVLCILFISCKAKALIATIEVKGLI